MKIFKYGLGLLLSVMLLSSCESKWPYFTPTNEDVTWELSEKTYSLQANETPIEITIQRGVATEALTVPITLTDPHNVYKVSTNSVNFAAGEFKKTITLTYNYAALTPGVEYTFDLTFSQAMAGPACSNVMKGNGMMELVYEDDCEFYPDVFWFVNATATAFTYRIGSLDENWDACKFMVQKAKGTTSYYKLVLKEGSTTACEVEFKYNGDETITIDKYSGYNEWANAWNASTRRLNYYAYVGGSAFYFTLREANCSADMATYIEFEGWIQKDGGYWPNSYNTYRDYAF
ncbi:MAG: hypothetical protein J5604_06920 [Bacteroidales bacterium]|nr:hypothetical protein [Bacteroidales bacterium]